MSEKEFNQKMQAHAEALKSGKTTMSMPPIVMIVCVVAAFTGLGSLFTFTKVTLYRQCASDTSCVALAEKAQAEEDKSKTETETASEQYKLKEIKIPESKK